MKTHSSDIFSWGHTRRFNAYSNYFKKKFGQRIQKVTIDAGFTCPNRDGTSGKEGCTFCNNDSFNPSYCIPEKGIEQQIMEGIEFHQSRYKGANEFLAYFQAYSNTYDSLEQLQKKYDQALKIPEIKGLIIGTRPDCIDEEKLDYFQSLSEKNYIKIEYGIESCYNKTLRHVNRGHTYETSKAAIEQTSQRGIRTGGHIIFGLPGESRQMMLNEANILSELPLSSIKFHQLQIIKNTAMAVEYQKNPDAFQLFDFNEYIDFMVEFIEQLNPSFVIERIASEAPPRHIAGGVIWKKRYDQILQTFENQLRIKDTWQGKFYNELTDIPE
jgi:hypothetical protein